MTHDELLKKIKVMDYVDADTYKTDQALCAVVELHKPNYGLCKACTTSLIHIAYPCPTIQAIEKGLA